MMMMKNFFYLYLPTDKILLFQIMTLDKSLRKFKFLQNLVLCDNFLQDIDGACLPRGLQFLELYVNNISKIVNLTNKAPKSLKHLGLGRNKLNNGKSLKNNT